MQLSSDVPRYYWLLRSFGHMHFLRKGLRSRVLHHLADPHRQLPGTFRVKWSGFDYSGQFSSYLDWNVFFFGGYEWPISSFIERALKVRGPDAVFFDVGANVGLHSLPASRFAKVVHAFDPFPAVLDVLRRRLADNAITNVTVHPVGLGETSGSAPYYMHPITSMQGSGSFLFADRPAADQLPIVCGDDYVEQNQLPLPDVIKIDTEGYDIRVLAGLKRTLAKSRPAVIMEVLDAQHEELKRLGGLNSILPEGYEVFALLGPRPVASLFLQPQKTFHLMRQDTSADTVENLALIPAEIADRQNWR